MAARTLLLKLELAGLIQLPKRRGPSSNGFRNTTHPFSAKKYNERFGVCPTNESDVHVKLPRYFDLDKYLCIKRKRVIRKDNTIAYEKSLYQIEERSGKKVVVEERLDGSVRMIRKGVGLKYKEITERPKKDVVLKADMRMHNRPQKPSKDHPWNKEVAEQECRCPKKSVCLLTK